MQILRFSVRLRLSLTVGRPWPGSPRLHCPKYLFKLSFSHTFLPAEPDLGLPVGGCEVKPAAKATVSPRRLHGPGKSLSGLQIWTTNKWQVRWKPNSDGVDGSNLIVLKDFSNLFYPLYPVNPIVHRRSIWEAEFIFPAVLEHHSVKV